AIGVSLDGKIDRRLVVDHSCHAAEDLLGPVGNGIAGSVATKQQRVGEIDMNGAVVELYLETLIAVATDGGFELEYEGHINGVAAGDGVVQRHHIGVFGAHIVH